MSEQYAPDHAQRGELCVQEPGVEKTPLRCEQLDGIRFVDAATADDWITHHQARVVSINPQDTHTPLRSRNCRIILAIPYGPGDVGYVLAGRVNGTAATADIMSAFTWIPRNAVSGYDLGRHSYITPTLWSWIMPVSARKPARFPILVPAQEHVDQYGGILMSHEVPNPTHPGKRDYHVVHPSHLAKWFATHPYCYGTLRRSGPCSYYADLDGEYSIAPRLRERSFAVAETWKIIDEVIATLAEWGVAVTRGDFRCDETPRENKYSVHILSDGFHFETEWLARVFGTYVHERLFDRDDIYHFTFTDRAGGTEERIIDDVAVRGRCNNFRCGGKRTSGSEGMLFPAPWPREGKILPDPPELYLRGIPQNITSVRRIGYRDFNEVGRAYLEQLRNTAVVRKNRVYTIPSRSPHEHPIDYPDWFMKDAWPHLEASGFNFQIRPVFDGDEFLLRVIGSRRLPETHCPRCAVDHPEDYTSIYAIVRKDRAVWNCFRCTSDRKRVRRTTNKE